LLGSRRTKRLGTVDWGLTDYDSLTQVTSVQIGGEVPFSIETVFRFACVRNAGRSRSDLKPRCTVNGAMARSAHAPARFALRKWLRTTMRPPGLQTRCISRITANGSGTTLMTYGA